MVFMNDLRQRAAGTLVKNAVFSPLSGLVIAAGIVLVGLGIDIPVIGPLLNLNPAWWLAGIVPIWAAVVGGQMLSRNAGDRAVRQILRETFDIDRITNPHLKMNVAQAIAYRERIDKAAAEFSDSGMSERMKDVANQVEEWVRRIYSLSTRLDAYSNDTIIASDLKSVPNSIRQLQQRLQVEQDDVVKRDMQDTIQRRQGQLDALRKLDQTMDRAELQLENTLTALGTVYSQMLLVDAKDVDSSKTQRLRENIAEQVASLNDVLSSMDEVYASGDQLARPKTNMAAS
jgi:hypothetical protein